MKFWRVYRLLVATSAAALFAYALVTGIRMDRAIVRGSVALDEVDVRLHMLTKANGLASP